MSVEPKLVRFKQNVLSKFQIYNSIFMTLPFDSITKTGVLLPLFHETCEKGFAKGDDPTTIVDTFFEKYQARRSKESLLEEYIANRISTIAFFKGLSQKTHGLIGVANGLKVSVRSLLYAIAGHEKHHLQVLRDRYS